MLKAQKYIYLILDLQIIILSLVIATLLRFDFQIPPVAGEYLAKNAILYILITLIFSILLGCYSSIFVYFGFSEILTQCIVATLVGLSILLLKSIGLVEVSGSITIIYCGTFFIISSAIRGTKRFNRWLSRANDVRLGNVKRALIIGAGDAGVIIAKHLVDNKQLGLFPVGVLDDNVKKHNKKIAGIKVLGEINQASFYTKKLDIEEIVLAIPSASDEEMKVIFEKVSSANVPTKIFQCVVDLNDYKNSNASIKEITIEDLLFRKPIKIDKSLHKEMIEGKTILVTGGAGSIGSEICKQILQNNCKKLIIFDINENGLFELNEDLKNEYEGSYITCLGSIRDKVRIKMLFQEYKPDIVFHAAAHKHVPMIEINPFEAIKNNVVGTLNVIEEAIVNKCQKFILISSDKAVNPSNVMGATKRVAELLVKAYGNQETEMAAVRFGNVLNSAGSVIPLFKKQIASGGPITVTDVEMTRYFMTIKEAVSLVLSAGASAKGSELFVLDMGKPVKIYDLAKNLIKLSGLKPFIDIDIKVTGLRSGEKLYEELRLDSEVVDLTSHKKIFIMRDNGIDKDQVIENLHELITITREEEDLSKMHEVLFAMIKEKVIEIESNIKIASNVVKLSNVEEAHNIGKTKIV